MGTAAEACLEDLLAQGGVYRTVPGTTPREILSALMELLPAIPSVSRDKLLEAMLEREALMSTSIGNGIALPHPRNPLITGDTEQFAAIAYPQAPVDWNSLDGKRVDTLLLIVSASAKQHLQTMAEIHYFCRQEDFYRLLKGKAPLEELLSFIREAKKTW